MHRGFIVFWRKFQDTSFYKDSYAVHLALHLILEANHEPKNFVFNRKEQTLERGQHLTGRKKLSEQTGINASTITHKLEILKNIGFLNIKTNNKFSIITICNYNKYQHKNNDIEQLKEQPSNSQVTAREQPSNTNNNTTTKNNVTTKTNKVFIPPTIEEVIFYCQERKNSIDPHTFIDFYQARGWKFKTGQPVKDWKACIRTWEARDNKPVDILTETQKRNIARFNKFTQEHKEKGDISGL